MSIKSGELMSIPELQEWLGGLGLSKTYELIRTQQIRSYRVGKLIRVSRQDAEAYLDANQYRPEANKSDEQRRVS